MSQARIDPKLVSLVNPNFVHPPISPYALDILTTALETHGFEVDVLDLTFQRDDWEACLTDYFSNHRPLLVGVTVRNTDTIYAQDQRVFIDTHRDVIQRIKQSTDAPVVAGGVGFSSMPFALTDYFGATYAVKGPGEKTLVSLAEALLLGTNTDTVPGLIINKGDGHVTRTPVSDKIAEGRASRSINTISPTSVNTVVPYTRRSGIPYKVDNLTYYRKGGLGNILTKNGCVFACAHCVEPDAKGTQFSRRDVTAIVDEIESLTDQGIYDVHTTDSEFNLAITHSKTVLREIVRRKAAQPASSLHKLKLWIYVQPVPFDEEFMELLVEAGCGGINLAPDHVRDDVLDGWKVTAGGSRYYTFDDVRLLCSLAHTYEIPTMVEVLLGMPGETRQTLQECVERTLDLKATVTGYSLGIRVFPYSPLGIKIAEACNSESTIPGLQSNTARRPIILKPMHHCSPVEYERQFMFDEERQFRPVYYISADLPEDLATVTSPSGRWSRSIDLLHDLIPAKDMPRVMLPTLPGRTQDDNNYADNPFLLRLVEMGYTGAFWSHWPYRDDVMKQARGGCQPNQNLIDSQT